MRAKRAASVVLLSDDADRLLARARTGQDVTRRLAIASLQPGDAGILEVTVTHLGATQTYRRKRGGEGLLCRVGLADGSGETEMVLWDDEVARAREFAPGARLRLRGPTVRWGRGVELCLGSAIIEPLTEDAPSLHGILQELGATRVVGEPPAPRFAAEASLEVAGRPCRIVLWDAALKDARQLLPGTTVRIDGARPHPQLEDWWIADAGARLHPAQR